jgi:hypothetical protein
MPRSSNTTQYTRTIRCIIRAVPHLFFFAPDGSGAQRKVLVEALLSELMLFDFRGSTRGSTHHATLGGGHQGTWVEEGKCA